MPCKWPWQHLLLIFLFAIDVLFPLKVQHFIYNQTIGKEKTIATSISNILLFKKNSNITLTSIAMAAFLSLVVN
jgi:hypothetical protein